MLFCVWGDVMHECTKENFLENIKNHKIEIIQDNGVYRHLQFSKGCFDQRFDIVTWPGHLCYTGDMGSYLFSRVEDMFTFFRRDDLSINTGYWAEKCLAAGTHDGISEYNQENAEKIIRDHLNDYEAPDKTRQEAISIISNDSEHECSLRNAISDMEHDTEGIFNDFWETNLHVRPYRYVWCCYALVWGISVYDKTVK
jgi:hypothetical protein